VKVDREFIIGDVHMKPLWTAIHDRLCSAADPDSVRRVKIEGLSTIGVATIRTYWTPRRGGDAGTQRLAGLKVSRRFRCVNSSTCFGSVRTKSGRWWSKPGDDLSSTGPQLVSRQPCSETIYGLMRQNSCGLCHYWLHACEQTRSGGLVRPLLGAQPGDHRGGFAASQVGRA
jgi:hypothetical protein